MEKKLNLIKVPRGQGIKIAKVFGCTPARVSQALSGDYAGSKLTIKIRHVALTQFDGVEYTPFESEKEQS